MKVIHRILENGDDEYYFPEGVSFFIVDERAPNDRVYKYSTVSTESQISAILGGDHIGTKDDGSPADARLKKFMSELEGEKHLKIVERPQ